MHQHVASRTFTRVTGQRKSYSMVHKAICIPTLAAALAGACLTGSGTPGLPGATAEGKGFLKLLPKKLRLSEPLFVLGVGVGAGGGLAALEAGAADLGVSSCMHSSQDGVAVPYMPVNMHITDARAVRGAVAGGCSYSAAAAP